MNHMIHNLTPSPADVFITYDLDFIPSGTPADQDVSDVAHGLARRHGRRSLSRLRRAQGRRAAATSATPTPTRRPQLRGHRLTANQLDGRGGRRARRHRGPPASGRAVDRPEGHPRRDARCRCSARGRSTSSRPGAVSWDVAMTATPEDWRVAVRRGDVLSVSATYDTRRASWYESMGIMPVAVRRRRQRAPTRSPRTSTCRGEVTHGHLRENRNHGGAFGGLPDARKLLSAPPAPSRTVPVRGFLYGRGDLGVTGAQGPPADDPPGPVAALRQPRRQAQRLPHDHELPRALQPRDGHRLPARRRPRALRLGQPRLRAGGPDAGGAADLVADAEADPPRHLHVLLPRAPVHARCVPRRAQARLSGRPRPERRRLIARRAGPSGPRRAGRSPAARAAPRARGGRRPRRCRA